MKKIIFTLMLAIVSSVWTMSGALCLGPIPNAMYQPFTTVSGTFVSVPIPCEPSDEYPCPACLTLALQTSDRLYYLTADNADIQTQLEAIEYQLSETADIIGSVSGTPYTEERYEYIRVQAVDTNPAPMRLPSLCDEWNIMAFKADGRGYYWYSTLHYQLTTDTIISARQYVKLQEQKRYVGAMREGEDEDIYYVPADSTHEYLLYAFNPRAGEPLENLWIGQRRKYYSDIGDITASKSSSDPRFIAVDIPYGENHEYHDQFIWVQGVGAQFGVCFDNEYETKVGLVLLCAYKNGEQVFVSNNWGDKYGCEAYKDSIPSDTIPLYVKDNPGSSTVDPVDPNQIYAVLEGDMLIIKDFTGAEIFFTLTNNGSLHSPARVPRSQSLSFTDSTSVELTENGLYDIELTSEAWNYIVFGSFDFNKIPAAVERIPSEHPTPTKILRNGQLLFRHGDHLYTITGIQIQ